MFKPGEYWKSSNYKNIPDSLKFSSATVLSSSAFYYVLYRTDLASNVFLHVQITPEPILILEVKIHPLYSGEMKLTQAWKDADIRMPRFSEISKMVEVPLPPDALLGSSSVSRHDYDTEYGRLFELVIPRFKSATFTIGPPILQLKQQERASTTTPLHVTNYLQANEIQTVTDAAEIQALKNEAS